MNTATFRGLCGRVAAAVLAGWSAVVPARAWVQMETGISWPDGNVPIVFLFGANKTLSDGGTWNSNAQWVLEQWNQNMGRVQFTWSSGDGMSGGENNSLNEAFFADDVYGDAFGSGTLAVTMYWSTATRISRADVIFNRKLNWNSYRGALRYSGTELVPEFRRVAVHEFGHVLGFDHPDERGQPWISIMMSTINNLETLQENDQDGAAAIYLPGVANQPPLPVFTRQPQPISVVDGNPASFSVDVSSKYTVTYQWFKNGAAIPGSTQRNHTIASVAVTDEGNYHVVATSSGGSVTSAPATLTAIAPSAPVITSQPSGGELSEGAEIWLMLEASGSALHYRWRRDGVDLADSDTKFHRVLGARPWDSGVYDGVVSNRGGSASTRAVQINVRPTAPPVIVSAPSRIVFQRGGDLNIPIGVSGGAALTYRWTRDGVPIASRHPQIPDLNLNASEASPGSYVFTVSSVVGSASTDPITVVEQPGDAPVLTKWPGDTVWEFGENRSVVVTATGYPSPTYTWIRDGVVLTTSGAAGYPIRTAADMGLYSVYAENSLGRSATKTFRVTARTAPETPHFIRSPVPVTTGAGATIPMRCTFSQVPAGGYRWYKDNVLLTGKSFAEFYISGFTAADEGTYRVEADVAGVTYRSADATVRLKPSGSVLWFEEHPAATTVHATEAFGFAPYVSGLAGTRTYQWYKDGALIPGEESRELFRYDVTAADAGLYVVKVTVAGHSVESEAARVEVLPLPAPRLTNQPDNLVAVAGEPVNLSVTALWGSTYEWRRNGVPVAGGNAATLVRMPVSAADAGDYTVVVRNSQGSVESAAAALTVQPAVLPQIIRLPRVVRAWKNFPAQLNVVVAGPAPLAYAWKKGGVAVPNGNMAILTLSSVSAADAGFYTLTVTGAAGSFETDPIELAYLGESSALRFTVDPKSQAAVIGSTVVLTASAYGTPVPAVQWRKNGVPIAGATKWKLELPAAQISDSGSYDVVATNSGGSVTSQSAQLTIGVDNGRIVALSARAQVGTGSDVLIPGFFVGGSVPKKLLIRALGPTLASYGVGGVLADPRLELKPLGGTTVLASNDDWTGAGADPNLAAVFAQVGASALPSGSKDAALVATLAPGLYTAVTSGANGGTGVALLEVFDVDPAAGKLTGISTRAIVGTGSSVLIPGIVVEGPVAKKLLIRVSGPALAQYGVGGTLADPKLELKTLGGPTLLANDNWDKTDAALTAAVAQIGLGAFADGSKDAAIVATLPAGLYTIVISGADGGSGVALVEVYEVP